MAISPRIGERSSEEKPGRHQLKGLTVFAGSEQLEQGNARSEGKDSRAKHTPVLMERNGRENREVL
jgi:hypothetical protein